MATVIGSSGAPPEESRESMTLVVCRLALIPRQAILSREFIEIGVRHQIALPGTPNV